MSRQQKQKMLKMLDDKVSRQKNPNVKLVIRHLQRYIDGQQSQYNSWVFENAIFKKSRLLQKWFEMSLDLSI